MVECPWNRINFTVPLPVADWAGDELVSDLPPPTASASMTLALPEDTSDPAATLADVTQAGQYSLQNKTVTVARPTEAGPGTVEACGLNSICHRAPILGFAKLPHVLSQHTHSQQQCAESMLKKEDAEERRHLRHLWPFAPFSLRDTGVRSLLR